MIARAALMPRRAARALSAALFTIASYIPCAARPPGERGLLARGRARR